MSCRRDEDLSERRRHTKFGRVEELEVYQENREILESRESQKVSCSHCNLYWGAPEEIRKHEESHTADGELEVAPEDHGLYARALATMKREDEERRKLEVDTQRNEAWLRRFLELYSRMEEVNIPGDFLKRMKITVLKDGRPLSLDEVEIMERQQHEERRLEDTLREMTVSDEDSQNYSRS